MSITNITFGTGIAVGAGINIGTQGGVTLPITITYSQIINQGDGPLTGTGFLGNYCIVQLTADQITAINTALGISGWSYALCYATWSADSINTTPNDSDLVLAYTGEPGDYFLYGTQTGWPAEQLGPWNLPVVISGVGGGG
jgi:hypothetical protein